MEARAQLPAFDFTTGTGVQGWQADHDISGLTPTAEGLRIQISGSDPYLHGPARSYPSGQLLWLHLRLKSQSGGGAQVFYYTDTPTEAKSVRFQVTAGDWQDLQVPMPALGSSVRLRIDPPGTSGVCVLGKLWFEERIVYSAPNWPRPELPVNRDRWMQIRSGSLAMSQSPRHWGEFEVLWKEHAVAIGNPQTLIGYTLTNALRWVSPFAASQDVVLEPGAGSRLMVRTTFTDPDSANWRIQQTFVPDTVDAIGIETSVMVDRDRSVLYLPFLTILPGVGSHGTNKNQGLFPGLEYLENEPSSSEADVAGSASWRLAPDTAKITFPLLALQVEGHYLGLSWEPQPNICAVHDSPDRQFNSGGHLFQLLWPGSDGANREERSLLPYRGETLHAGQTYRVRAVIFAGAGTSMVPAIEAYVRRQGLPAVPSTGHTRETYFNLAAHGWLDSKIRATNLYRHAWWPGFNPQPASDAALWMNWLSERVADSALATRLKTAADAALTEVSRPLLNASQIGHVRYPAPALVFGAVIDNATESRRGAESLRSGFGPDGSIKYQAPAGGMDYGRTQPSGEASGFTANRVLSLLNSAIFSGDETLLRTALEYLRAMSKFRGGVPRGAQTWEIPLHTPDILASAYLVRAYTLGHALTGDPDFLQQAREWAWTGLPFIYLTPPTSSSVGVYSAIPVYGATGWVAPVWMGQPVQWCGLVYADALYQLAPLDPTGPWKRLADGIAAAGIQHTWPLTDLERQGLLPDFYLLRPQRSDGPAINPATLLPSAVRLFGEQPPYAFRALLRYGLLLHAPGRIDILEERTDGLSLRVDLALARPGRVYITGLSSQPELRIDQQPVELNAPHQYRPAEGRLVILLERSSRIDLKYPAVAALEIQPTNVPGRFRISWPAAASEYALEVAPSVDTPTQWRRASTQGVPDWTRYVSQQDASATMGLYRLNRYSADTALKVSPF